MRKNKFLAYFFLLILLTFLFLRSVLVFLNSADFLFKGGSVDLRNRIVGTRVALTHSDPYLYVWSEGEPIQFLDPLIHPEAGFARLTVTPAALLVHAPFSDLSFDLIVVIWFFFQWLCLVLITFFFYKIANSRLQRSLIIFVGLFFANSSIWTTHLGFGQIYVVYTLLLTITVFAFFKKKTNLAFILLGILVLLRPTYAVVPTAFFVFKKFRKFIKPTLLSMTTIFVVTMVIFNTSIWNQYFYVIKGFAYAPPKISERGFVPSEIYPNEIEGWSLIDGEKGFSLDLENSFRGFFVNLTGGYAPAPIFWYVLVLATLLGSIMIIKFVNIKNPQSILLITVAASIIGEYFIPARRYIYADVQWIALVLIILIVVINKRSII